MSWQLPSHLRNKTGVVNPDAVSKSVCEWGSRGERERGRRFGSMECDAGFTNWVDTRAAVRGRILAELSASKHQKIPLCEVVGFTQAIGRLKAQVANWAICCRLAAKVVWYASDSTPLEASIFGLRGRYCGKR